MDLALLGVAALAVLAGMFTYPRRLLPAAGMYVLLSRTWLLVRPKRLTIAMNVTLALTGVVAVGTLALEYGFHEPPVSVGILHAVQTAVVAIFILDRVVRLELARGRLEYLRQNWVDFALMALAGAALGVQQLHTKILPAAALYVIITQAYILVALILRAVSVNLDFAGSGVHPTWLLIGSFAAMCLVGSGLLMLPAATQVVEPETQPSVAAMGPAAAAGAGGPTQPGAPAPPAPAQPGERTTKQLGEEMDYADALFTATSATCVTGLIVRNTGSEFTIFGQAVILALIQMGGLGIMLFGTALALLVGRGLSVRSSDALGQMIGTKGIGQLARVAKFVVLVTIGLEALGAVLLYPMFAADLGHTGRAVWCSIFHSVSAFCNAGFSLYDQNMQPLRGYGQVLGVMAPLIVLGGVGFPVLEDCAKYVKGLIGRRLRRRKATAPGQGGLRRPRLSLHSKLVLSMTVALILLGTAGLMLFGHTRPHVGVGGPDDTVRRLEFREALFQSITARTAGFNTVSMRSDLSEAGRLLMCGLMIVGGSPASTAGGMKTVTIALLLLTAWSMIRRRGEVEAFRRSLSATLLEKAVTLAVLYLSLVAAVTLLLCVAQPAEKFMTLFFEACSACGTVGLSTGITKRLGLFGKLIVTFGMFVGRIGPLTLLLALTTRVRRLRYSYPAEDVVIG